jgi:hypothetical protein
MNLCRFFKAISATIEAVVSYTVAPFLEQVANLVSSDGSGVSNLKVGNYTLTDLQRSVSHIRVLRSSTDRSVIVRFQLRCYH